MDEWLLQQSDSADQPCEFFRLWENPVNAVIIGRSSKVDQEVNKEWCSGHGIEFLRRGSGGASVVIGPGCLMYAVVLDYRLRPELKMLDQAHQFVMQKMQQAIRNCGVDVQFQGTCDLTLQGRKFSGNSLRCQRHSFLYHGTLLYDFDLSTVQNCLGTPPRQPDYRAGRSHLEFVTNLPVQVEPLSQSLLDAWGSTGNSDFSFQESTSEIETLARDKYLSRKWTYKR